MQPSVPPSADHLLRALAAYHDAVQTKGMTESQVDAVFERAERLVPHANLQDLVFWGERDRDDDEVVEEALYREQLWLSGGDLAVLVREHDLMASALEDATLDYRFRDYAEERLTVVLSAIDLLKSHRAS